jgi:hypothetical protein
MAWHGTCESGVLSKVVTNLLGRGVEGGLHGRKTNSTFNLDISHDRRSMPV